jgi:hypothetical protein
MDIKISLIKALFYITDSFYNWIDLLINVFWAVKLQQKADASFLMHSEILP